MLKRRLLTALVLLLAALPGAGAPARGQEAAAQIDLPGPPGSLHFGTLVAALPGGNIVVSDPSFRTGPGTPLGAVFLYHGATRRMLSRLAGTGPDASVVVLESGDYVVASPWFNHGPVLDVGAVTFCSGATGCGGLVSAENSLVGSQAGDRVGLTGVIALKNADFLVSSLEWDRGALEDAGAVTFCRGASCSGETVSAANSLVGSAAFEAAGGRPGDEETPPEAALTALPDGGYVVHSPEWGGAGADGPGALTYCPAGAGCSGEIDGSNSLVGSQAGDLHSVRITPLDGGGFAAAITSWSSGAVRNAGAVYRCGAAGGCSGEVSAQNSRVGAQTDDWVGSGGVIALPGGGFVIASPLWDWRDLPDAGAVTFCPPSGCTGTVRVTNSLVGDQARMRLGARFTSFPDVTALTDGGYVVWSMETGGGGKAARCPAAAGCSGTISGAPGLTGPQVGDAAGSSGVTPLPGGAYAVVSPFWDNGAAWDAGAVTFCSGADGCNGQEISQANSLVGVQPGDMVGFSFRTADEGLTVLPDGAYLVSSPEWKKGDLRKAGAVTYCPASGCRGQAVTAANSLTGSQAEDQVGYLHSLALGGGRFAVLSPAWDSGAVRDAGAVTLCERDGCAGEVVSTANSLVGASAHDNIGHFERLVLEDGSFILRNPLWDHGPILDAGSVTLCPAEGCSGPVSAENSVLAEMENGGSDLNFDYDQANNQLVVGRPRENTVSFLAGPEPSGETPTQTSLSASHTEIEAGQELALTAVVASASGPPPGQVSFRDGSETLGRASLDANGQALFTTRSLAPGVHHLTARYEGNYDFQPSLSAPVTVVVAAVSGEETRLSLSVSNLHPAPGESLTLTAAVSAAGGAAGGVPTGEVIFYAGESSLGAAALDAGGQAALSVTLAEGSYSLSARYPGAAGFAASSSDPLAVQVGGGGQAGNRLFLPLLGK